MVDFCSLGTFFHSMHFFVMLFDLIFTTDLFIAAISSSNIIIFKSIET